ncbi:HIT domain-containing protein [Nonomuraea sp. NPDC050394]|uniref:HIT domain-containing protein n=1 Tax=Nonomuraea sp. NPDC050394 TaxID=3364363 RepID=UPI0037888948
MPEPAGFCVGSDFCQELAGAADTTFRRVYGGQPAERVVGRGATVSLLADMSPLTHGHLLLVSNKHYVSFGEVMAECGEAVTQALGEILPQYKTSFGEPVIMEHGSTKRMNGSACITHAHLHLLPLRFAQVHAVMKRDGLASAPIDGIAGLRRLGLAGLPYFYCGDGDTHRVYGVAQATPRQYLRSVAGRLLGIDDPEWDYAVVVRKHLLSATMEETADWLVPLP